MLSCLLMGAVRDGPLLETLDMIIRISIFQ